MLRKVERRIKVGVERKKENRSRKDEMKKEGKEKFYEKINMINLKYFPLS
jgi:hypothetical protein